MRKDERGKRPPLSAEDRRHGTYSGYTNHGCRCDACRLANKEKMREYWSRSTAKRKRNERVNKTYRELRERGFSSYDANRLKNHEAAWWYEPLVEAA